MTGPRQAPSHCPVCTERLALTRLSCDACGTELSGHFPTCEYCSLGQEDRETLRVFLASRGNMKEVERHLQVSYPTARARFESILEKLGLVAASTDPVPDRILVLELLSKRQIDLDEALRRLS